MIIVRLPPSLRPDGRDTLVVDEDVRSVGALIDVLDQRVPGFRALFDEGGCNFAVNDEVVLWRVRDRALRPGDTVEVVPSMAGG
jgi:molybdopterin converting factor small subunit